MPNKATHQMAWVQYMNSLKAQAEEIVLAELIYNWGKMDCFNLQPIFYVGGQFLNCEMDTFWIVFLTIQELSKAQGNNTDINNTEYSNTDLILSFRMNGKERRG